MKSMASMIRPFGMFLLLGLLSAAPPSPRTLPATPIAHHSPGEILLRLNSGIDAETLLRRASIRDLLPVGTSHSLISPRRIDIIRLNLGKAGAAREESILAALRRHPDIMAASLNFRRPLARRPDDPLYNRQWNLRNLGDNTPFSPGIPGADVDVESLWEVGTGSASTVVAVLDTGIDYLHPDLAANIWRNPLEIPANGMDDDGNGYVDDVVGYDFAADDNGGNDSDPMDRDGHGTHVAGIIAARGDNALGVSGLSWRTRLVPIKTVRPDGFNYTDDILEALEYVRVLKRSGTADIVAVNCSFGGGGYSEVEELAYREVAAAGIIVLAAAGNGGDDDTGDDNDAQPFYPASYEVNGILAVAATTAADTLADFSNYGFESVDLAAPGDGVFSTVPRGRGRLAGVETTIGVLPALGIEFSVSSPGVSGILVPCGQGIRASDFPGEVNRGIALIERGETTFREKVSLAEAAGALAAVIFNNLPGNFSGTLQEPGPGIPAVSISRENGLRLSRIGFSRVTVVNRADDYDFSSGTSMATPHAAGALALLASIHGPESLARRVVRLMLANTPLAQLSGRVSSGGRLDLGGAALPAPTGVSALRESNHSMFQTEYVVRISWNPIPQASRLGVTGYRVFQTRPEFRMLGLLDVSATHMRIRRVRREADLEFGVAAVDSQGRCGAVGFAAAREE